MKIVLDANFLIDLIRYGIRLEELKGNELFTLDLVLKELEKISQRKTKEASLANIASGVFKKSDVKILKSKKRYTDLELLRLAKEGYAIATHDRSLKSKIKKVGGETIFIRQKKYFMRE